MLIMQILEIVKNSELRGMNFIGMCNFLNRGGILDVVDSKVFLLSTESESNT